VWPVYSLLLDVVTTDNSPRHKGAWISGGIIPRILDIGMDFYLHYQTAVLPEKEPPGAIRYEALWAPKAVLTPSKVIRTASSQSNGRAVLDHGSYCSAQGLWEPSCCVYCYLNHTCSNTTHVYFSSVCYLYVFRSY
jgi:hypothetical protein